MGLLLTPQLLREMGWTDEEAIKKAVKESQERNDGWAMMESHYRRKLEQQERSCKEAIEVLRAVIAQRDEEITELREGSHDG